MTNNLNIMDTNISCQFDVSEIQNKLDSIIVMSKLLGIKTKIKEYYYFTTFTVYKESSEIDYAYMKYHINDNGILNYLTVQKTTNPKKFIKDKDEILSFLNEVEATMIGEN